MIIFYYVYISVHEYEYYIYIYENFKEHKELQCPAKLPSSAEEGEKELYEPGRRSRS